MNNKKRKWLKVTALLTCTSLVSTTLVSCTSYSNSVSQDSTMPPPSIGDINKPIVSDGSKVDDAIKQATVFVPENFTSISTNKQSIPQNINNYLQCGDFTSYTGKSEKLKDDLYIYLYKLFKENKTISILNPQLLNFSVENENIDEINFSSIISLKMSVNIHVNESSKITIGEMSFNVSKDEKQILTISLEKQQLKPSISEYVRKQYLGWKVDKVKFSFQGKEWTENNFAPTAESFSNAFLYNFENLSAMQTYFDLEKQYQNQMLNLGYDNFTNQIKNKTNNEFEAYLKNMVFAQSFANVLKQNLTVEDLIREIAPSVIDILIANNIIPSYLKDFLNEAISDKQTPFINIFEKNKELIKKLAQEYLGSIWIIVSSYIDMFKPGIQQGSEEFEKIDALLKGLPENVKNVVYSDVLGITGPAKPLLDIIVDNFETIVDLIPSNNDTFVAVKELLKKLLVKENGQYVKIYDAILKDNATKNSFVTTLLKLLPLNSTITDYINILFTDNDNLNATNLMAFFNSIAEFLNVLLEKNASYTNIYDMYKNLKISTNTVKQPSLNTSAKTISFEVNYKVELLKPATLNLVPFKNLISDKAFYALLDKLLKENNQTLPDAVKLTRLKSLILKYIPDQIRFGDKNVDNDSRNQFVLTIKADNEPIYFDPTKMLGQYLNGFSFKNEINIRYYDQNMILDITKNNGYKNGGNLNETLLDFLFYSVDMDLHYEKFWRSLIENVINRDYSYIKWAKIHTDQIIANQETYNENQYYSNYVFSANKNINSSEIASLVDKRKDREVVKDISSVMFYEWSNGMDTQIVRGYKPVLNENHLTLFNKKIFDLSKIEDHVYNITYLPLINTSLPISMHVHKSAINDDLKIDMNLSVFLMNVDIHFPFKVYEASSEQMLNHLNFNIFDFKTA